MFVDLRDERLLVGIAVRDQLAVGRDDHREAVLADADAVDHPPHLLEAELADEPAGRLVEARQVDGEDVVGSRSSSTRIGDIDDALEPGAVALRDLDARLADTARGDGRAGSRRTA